MSRPLTLDDLAILEHYLLKLYNTYIALEGLPAYHQTTDDLRYALRGVRDSLSASHQELLKIKRSLDNG